MQIFRICFLLLTSIMISSCTSQEINKSLLALAVIVFILALRASVKQQNRKDEKFSEYCKQNEILDTRHIGDYVGGHPLLDNIVYSPLVFVKDNEINICVRTTDDELDKLASIDIESVKNIYIEDFTSVQKEVTLGRVLLVGVFALAWKKKKKDELSFLCIDWTNGKFENKTLFKYEGKMSMQKANADRNHLINSVNKTTKD